MNNSAAAELELNRYFVCKLTEADYNLTLLNGGKKMKVISLVYHRLPKKFLAVPASSVPSERIFSIAGEILNKKRSRLHCANVDLLIFLN